jgi:hypothetical protein
MYERSGQERGTAVQAVRERRVLPRRRRSANGPRPVRPLVSAVAVRPAEAERPQVPSGGRRVPLPLPGVRTLVRRPLPVPLHVPRGRAPFERLRRALAGLAVAAAAAAVVVSLGVLASSAAAVRVAEEAVRSPQSVVVTVGAERTPWEVAQRLAPGAPGPEVAALAERIVTDNSLGSVPLRPGQVLRVSFG